MKPIKMLGLAATTALVAMALVGASSAMAETTVLCSEDGGSSCSSPLTHVHEATLTGEKAKLLTSVLNIECEVLFLGDTVAGTSAPLVIRGSFTYTGCNSNCTATEENGPAEISVLKEGHETADVTGEGLVHLSCSGFINCRYNDEGLAATAVGPLLSTNLLNGHTIISEAVFNKESGALCASTTKLDLNLHPLVHTYIAN